MVAQISHLLIYYSLSIYLESWFSWFRERIEKTLRKKKKRKEKKRKENRQKKNIHKYEKKEKQRIQVK